MRGTYSVMIILSMFFSSLSFGENEQYCKLFQETMDGCVAGNCVSDVEIKNIKCNDFVNLSIGIGGGIGMLPALLISEVLKKCAANSFKTMSSTSYAESQCDIDAKKIYQNLCDSRCMDVDISKETQEKTKKALIKEAKEVLTKMYKNTIWESYELLSLLPDNKFIYGGLPKSCKEGSSQASPTTKSIVKDVVTEITESYNKKAQKSIKNDERYQPEPECFPSGLVSSYFKLGHGKFNYLDQEHGRDIKREIDFSSFKKVGESFDDYVDKCYSSSKSICTDSIIQRKKDAVAEKISKAKEEMAKKCEDIQTQLNKLDEADGLSIALNPNILNLRKNFEQISFKDGAEEKQEYKTSVVEACEKLYDQRQDTLSLNTTDNIDINDQTCSSVKKHICGKNESEQKNNISKILDQKKDKPLKEIYNSLHGMNRFATKDAPEMERLLCENIKKKYYNSANASELSLEEFTMQYFSGTEGIDNIDDLVSKLKNDKLFLSHFSSDSDAENFIRGLASFNTVNKQEYLKEMKRRKKVAFECYEYHENRNTGQQSKPELDKACYGQEAIIAIAENTTKRAAKKFEALEAKGFKNFETTMAGTNKTFKELDIQEPSRAPASTQNIIANNSAVSPVGEIQSSLPIIDQIQNDIIQTKNSMDLASKNLAIADKEIMSAKLNEQGIPFEEAQKRIERLEEDKKILEEKFNEQARLLEDLKRDKDKGISERDSFVNQEKKILEAKNQFATVKTQNLDTLEKHPIFKEVPEIATNTKVLYSALNNRVVSPLGNKIGFEAILPVTANEYDKIFSQKNAVPVELKTFNPQVFQYRSFEEIKKEYGADAIYQVGESYFVKVADNKTGDQVVYQLRTEKTEDGLMLVNGVFVPVSNKEQVKNEVKRLPASVIQEGVIEKEKQAGITDPKKLSRSITDKEVKSFQVDLYRELIMVLKELK